MVKFGKASGFATKRSAADEKTAIVANLIAQLGELLTSERWVVT